MTTYEDAIDYLDKLIEAIGTADEQIGELVSEREDDCEPASRVACDMLTQIGIALDRILDIREEWLA